MLNCDAGFSTASCVRRLAEVRDRLAALGAEVITGTPREFTDYLAREIPKWAKVAKDSGARAE